MNVELDGNFFALRRLVLIDAYPKGAITEQKLDGHISLTDANGVGNTSLLRLIPLFYGENPNKLVQGGGPLCRTSSPAHAPLVVFGMMPKAVLKWMLFMHW